MPGRRRGREWLDGAERLRPDELAQNLDDLARIKRWLGVDAALWRRLRAACPAAGGR